MNLDRSTEAFLKALAGELRRRREASGLSMNRLAERAGISQQMVSYVERGMKTPSAGTLYRLAEALETEPAALCAVASLAVPEIPSRRILKYPEITPEKQGMVAEDPPEKPAPAVEKRPRRGH